jgi:hypothetical protein
MGNEQSRIRSLWARASTCDKIVGFTAAVWVGPAAIKTFVVVTLRFVGFSAHGPVAGSWAAAWMSNVARMDAHTSIGAAILAWAQSVSMTWPLITTSAAVLGVISGVYVAVRCAVGNFEGTLLSSEVFGGHDAVGDRERLARIDEDIEANRGQDTDELVALGDAGNVDTAESPCADDVRAPLLVLS